MIAREGLFCSKTRGAHLKSNFSEYPRVIYGQQSPTEANISKSLTINNAAGVFTR